MRSVLLGLHLYERDTGEFPNNLNQLYPDYIDAPSIFFTKGWRPKELRPLLYHSGAKTPGPILASQHQFQDKYNIGFSDGHVGRVSEIEYRKAMNSVTWQAFVEKANDSPQE